jgi:hypothetical protein
MSKISDSQSVLCGFQGNRGYISVMVTLKFTYFLIKLVIFLLIIIEDFLQLAMSLFLMTVNGLIHIENPTRCHSVSKFYFIFIWSSTCFGRHTAHHQEPKTALEATGFACVEGCLTCSCWTLPGSVGDCLTASSNHTSDNLPGMQNQRLLVQF